MDEEKLKQAFSKIKEDMINLGKEISEIRENLLTTNQLMKQINEDIIKLKLGEITKEQTSTNKKETSTHPVTSTHPSTHPYEIEGSKQQNLGISTGNQGVSTDRQTDRQTVRHIPEIPEIPPIKDLDTTNESSQLSDVVTNPIIEETEDKPIQQQISEASEILDSLDDIRKDIRKKFKRITRQEMLVFSTIYQLEEQGQEIDYKILSIKLNLSQSSIRDYIQRIIDKGIPIIKEKLNNKKIILHISQDLKKIATLDTIIKLRKI